MTNKWCLVNVVCYDGCDAWVAKFIFSGNSEKNWRKDYERMGYDAEPLKFDLLTELSFDNIQAYINSNETNYKLIADRFKTMYF